MVFRPHRLEARAMDRFFSRFNNGFSAKIDPAFKEILLNTSTNGYESYVGHNQVSMAVRPRTIDLENWLAVDWSYPSFIKARKLLIDSKLDHIIAYRAHEGRDHEVEQACLEVLNMVIEHLTTRYPDFFAKKDSTVYNAITNEIFDLDHTDMKPLEIAARLAIEDFNIFLPREIDGPNGKQIQYQLAATATVFPAAWIIKDRIGTPIVNLHDPVPGWHSKVATAVESRLKKIGFAINGRGEPSDKEEMERLAVFPQIDRPDLELGELLFVQNGDQFYPPGLEPTQATMMFRRKRQTFRRIASVNGVLFGVRTSIQFLAQLTKDDLEALIEQVMKLAESHAAYKERERWMPCLKKFAKEKYDLEF